MCSSRSNESRDKWRNALVIWFEQLGKGDVPLVGGKNASLGEMVCHLADRASGFHTGSPPPRTPIGSSSRQTNCKETIVRSLEIWPAEGAARRSGIGSSPRFIRGTWPADLAGTISSSYQELCRRSGKTDADVAVRSSATAEDLPDASFAGQQETFLNIRGVTALLDACRRCYASLFTDRAISYRQAKGFDHLKVALSIGIQNMVRSDLGGAGVMFSIDTETGFDKVAIINAAWGLGENVVQGAVDPDEYQVYKPLLSDASLTPIIEKDLGEKAQKMIYARGRAADAQRADVQGGAGRIRAQRPEILKLARWACTIERHYGRPMDMEWAKDGETGELFIVQARPETVQSRRQASAFKSYRVKSKGRTLATGISIGEAVTTGRVCMIESPSAIDRFVDGAMLVTRTTDPDWVPIMRRAAAIVTDHGGRTSHAAIVSRELGLPAIVGTGNATQLLHDGQEVTVSCAEGEQGFVYEGFADFDAKELDLSRHPEDANPDDAEPRQSGRGVPLVADSRRRRRPRPHGVHRQQSHQDPSDGVGALRHARR